MPREGERGTAPHQDLPAIADGFGERLKQARIEAGYETQPQLAAAVGVNLNTISRHESGRHQPTIDLLYTYARILGVSVSYLQHGTPPPAAVIQYLSSPSARGLRPETRERLLNAPWLAIIGSHEPDLFQVDQLASVIDRALIKQASLLDAAPDESSDESTDESAGTRRGGAKRAGRRPAPLRGKERR